MNQFLVLLIATVISVDANLNEKKIEQSVQVVAENRFPWYVTIQGNLTNGQSIQCGGALISNAIVLTGAHCVENVTYEECFIKNRQSEISLIPQSKIIHPDYNSKTFANNVALLRLPVNITSSESIQWVQLPAVLQTSNQYVNAKRIHGVFSLINNQCADSEIPRYTQIRVSNENGQLYFELGAVTNNTLCTLGLDLLAQSQHDSDSGGGLWIIESTNNTRVGILAFNRPQEISYPSVFCRSSSFQSWFN